MYISLAGAALMGISEANQWAFNYFTSFSLDFFMVAPLINYLKVGLYQYSVNSTTFISQIIYLLIKGHIENA